MKLDLVEPKMLMYLKIQLLKVTKLLDFLGGGTGIVMSDGTLVATAELHLKIAVEALMVKRGISFTIMYSRSRKNLAYA